MIKLKVSSVAPANAVVLARVSENLSSSDDIVTLKDTSLITEENRVPAQGKNHVVRVSKNRKLQNSDPLVDADPIVYVYSSLDVKSGQSTPLPYVYTIGSNVLENGALSTYRVYNDEAAEEWSGSNELGRQIIEKNIRIVDQLGVEAKDVKFTVVSVSTTTISGHTVFNVTIATSHVSTIDRFLKVVVSAMKSGDTTPRRGVSFALNGVPYIEKNLRAIPYVDSTVDVTEPTLSVLDIISCSLDYSKPLNYAAINSSTTLPSLNAIRLVPEEKSSTFSFQYRTDAVRITKDAVNTDFATNFDTTYSGPVTVTTHKSIRDLAREINEANLGIRAYVINDYDNSTLGLADGSNTSVSISSYGTNIPFRNTTSVFIGAYYDKHAHIFVDRPMQGLSNYDNWHPLIKIGAATVKHVVGNLVGTIHAGEIEASYTLAEKDAFTFYTATGSRTDLSRNNQIATKPLPNALQVPITGRLSLVAGYYLVVTYKDKDITSLVKDVDLNAGVIYFRDNLPEGEYLVSYSYKHDNYLPIRELDLNPKSCHNPEARDRLFVVYITPSSMLYGNTDEPPVIETVTYTKTLWVKSGQDLDQIYNQIENQKDDEGRPLPSIILGIYQCRYDKDIDQIKILDLRTRGGGISDPSSKEPESNYFADIGFVDGEPFRANGPVAIEVPISVTRSKELTIDNPTEVVRDGIELPGNDSLKSIEEGCVNKLVAGTYALVRTYNG